MDDETRALTSRLGLNPDDRDLQLGVHLANADLELVDELVALRKAKGMNQQAVADRMHRDRSAVSNFERLDGDPRLSTIRRYALAVGARIGHSVSDADATGSDGSVAELGADAQTFLSGIFVARSSMPSIRLSRDLPVPSLSVVNFPVVQSKAFHVMEKTWDVVSEPVSG